MCVQGVFICVSGLCECVNVLYVCVFVCLCVCVCVCMRVCVYARCRYVRTGCGSVHDVCVCLHWSCVYGVCEFMCVHGVCMGIVCL